MAVEGGDLWSEGEQVSQAPAGSSASGHIPGLCWSHTQLDSICMRCSPRAQPCPGRRPCSSDYELINSVQDGRYDGMSGREKNIAK